MLLISHSVPPQININYHFKDKTDTLFFIKQSGYSIPKLNYTIAIIIAQLLSNVKIKFLNKSLLVVLSVNRH